MKNFVQPANVCTFTAPAGGVVSGNLYQIGKFIGVATATIAAGLKFEMQLEGAVSVNKVAAEPWTEGMLVYFNTGSGLATSTTGTTVLVGGSLGVFANPTAQGVIRLNGVTLP